MVSKKKETKKEVKIDNKERNKIILEVTCDFFETVNREVEDVFVEDVVTEEGENDQVLIGVTSADPASLIGYKGRSLASMQQILGLMIKNKLGYWVKALLDVNEYRQEQKNRLKEMVVNAAKRVQETGKQAILSPMSSYERRICHMAIEGIEGVMTESEGEGEDRHVVIKLKV